MSPVTETYSAGGLAVRQPPQKLPTKLCSDVPNSSSSSLQELWGAMEGESLTQLLELSV